jgi:hypothetical protein
VHRAVKVGAVKVGAVMVDATMQFPENFRQGCVLRIP